MISDGNDTDSEISINELRRSSANPRSWYARSASMARRWISSGQTIPIPAGGSGGIQLPWRGVRLPPQPPPRGASRAGRTGWRQRRSAARITDDSGGRTRSSTRRAIWIRRRPASRANSVSSTLSGTFPRGPKTADGTTSTFASATGATWSARGRATSRTRRSSASSVSTGCSEPVFPRLPTRCKGVVARKRYPPPARRRIAQPHLRIMAL